MTDRKEIRRGEYLDKTYFQSPGRQTKKSSPHFGDHQHSHHHRKRKRPSVKPPPSLPFNSHRLAKEDFVEYKNTFALYLDIQKGKYLEDLDDRQIKGRWKNFIHKWNRGELSEGWYDPSTKRKASENVAENILCPITEDQARLASRQQSGTKSPAEHELMDRSDSDLSIGPTLPGQEVRPRIRKFGPTIPLTHDLQIVDEIKNEEWIARQENIRRARKVDLKLQKEALDELIPQSMPGTRERQLQKKKELQEKMKSFREKSPGATDIPDSELLGDKDDLESYRKAKQEIERKKNERELRKEALLKARIAEREERLREYKAKEEATIGMFKALAKQRFG